MSSKARQNYFILRREKHVFWSAISFQTCILMSAEKDPIEEPRAKRKDLLNFYKWGTLSISYLFLLKYSYI